MDTRTPVLEVDNIQKLYKNGRGVRSMSFSLYAGDIFGLLGSNGSGKTTAIKCICGLCPYKGEVRLFGESVADNPREALKRAGFIVETPSFYGNLNALQNLQLAAKYYGMSKAETNAAAEWALEIVGLAGFKRDRAEHFSLGMKARLGLALCFVSNPAFMALDEPLNGLDIEGMVDIRNIILNHASSTNAAFLISSHLAAEVEKTCNCVGVMNEGELLETASMRDVIYNFGSVEAYYLHALGRVAGYPGAGAVYPDMGMPVYREAGAEGVEGLGSPQFIEAPQVPQTSQIQQAPQVPQAPQVQQAPQVPQAPQVQQATQAPQVPQAPQIQQAPQFMDTPQQNWDEPPGGGI